MLGQGRARTLGQWGNIISTHEIWYQATRTTDVLNARAADLCKTSWLTWKPGPSLADYQDYVKVYKKM